MFWEELLLLLNAVLHATVLVIMDHRKSCTVLQMLSISSAVRNIEH
jgi:hypothetical protein